MILKGSQRANGGNLAAHLMNTRDNEHVALHELRGFCADDLEGAFKEAEAISRGTRCSQYLFSLSLSPPETDAPWATGLRSWPRADNPNVRPPALQLRVDEIGVREAVTHEVCDLAERGYATGAVSA